MLFELICLAFNKRKEIWVDSSYNGLETTNVPSPKIHINRKINFGMEKTLKTNVEWALYGDYTINKVHMK